MSVAYGMGVNRKKAGKGRPSERKACRDCVVWSLCIIEISLCYYALGARNELLLEYVWIAVEYMASCRINGTTSYHLSNNHNRNASDIRNWFIMQ